jgi:hypothetical protein
MWDKVVGCGECDTHRFSIPHTHQKGMERLTRPLVCVLVVNYWWYQNPFRVRIRDRASYLHRLDLRT